MNRFELFEDITRSVQEDEPAPIRFIRELNKMETLPPALVIPKFPGYVSSTNLHPAKRKRNILELRDERHPQIPDTRMTDLERRVEKLEEINKAVRDAINGKAPVPKKDYPKCEHGSKKSQCVHCSPHNACTTCHSQHVPKKYRYFPQCTRCYYITHPDVKARRNFKTKEMHMREELRDQFSDLDMIFDKQVSGGCSRRRPDVVIEMLTHVVIVECDENQHSGYNCENKRTMELFQDFGNRPIVFIRFNPDSYRDESGDKVQGCFTLNDKGSLEVCEEEWDRRLPSLFDSIRHSVETIPEKEVTEIPMFYNE
jgi:hypothetical protein